MNQQPITKAEIGDGHSLKIVSIFKTIQGEGPFAGTPAVFIRLAHCNLRCPACDTDYTTGAIEYSIERIVFSVETKSIRRAYGEGPLVVITGGEPFRQNITRLCNILISKGFRVQVETNGTLAHECGLSSYVTIVCSPKTTEINPALKSRANCFKYVLDYRNVSETDGLPLAALEHPVKGCVARPYRGAPIYVQPMDAKDEVINAKNLKAAMKSCMAFNYVLQLQIHKIIGVP